jgi:hypothetical protein
MQFLGVVGWVRRRWLFSMLERRMVLLALGLSVLASSCTQPSPFGLTRTQSGEIVVVTRKCRPIRIKSLEFAWHGDNKVPGDSDDEVLFTASSARGVSVDRLVLDVPGLSSFSTTGTLTKVRTDDRPFYVQVRLADRAITYVVGFRFDRLSESSVIGERVKSFDPSDFCVASQSPQ